MSDDMPAYSFAALHAEAVEKGFKTRTIRALGRRRHAVPGERVALYAGMRTRDCRLLRTATCTAVRPVLMEIDEHARLVAVAVNGASLEPGDLPEFARLDGFADAASMGRFFHTLHGPGRHALVMIEWER